MNKRLLFATIVCFFSFLVDASVAQEQENILNKLQQLRQMFDTSDPLKKTFKDVETLKSDHLRKQLGVDKETAALLRNLKNPFIPQLPKPKVEKDVVEEPVEREQPPEVIERPQPQVKPPRPEKPKISKPDFALSGLVWNTDNPQAIINNQVINVGDIVNHWTIVDITHEGVEVTYMDQTYMITPP